MQFVLLYTCFAAATLQRDVTAGHASGFKSACVSCAIRCTLGAYYRLTKSHGLSYGATAAAAGSPCTTQLDCPDRLQQWVQPLSLQRLCNRIQSSPTGGWLQVG